MSKGLGARLGVRALRRLPIFTISARRATIDPSRPAAVRRAVESESPRRQRHRRRRRWRRRKVRRRRGVRSNLPRDLKSNQFVAERARAVACASGGAAVFGQTVEEGLVRAEALGHGGVVRDRFVKSCRVPIGALIGLTSTGKSVLALVLDGRGRRRRGGRTATQAIFVCGSGAAVRVVVSALGKLLVGEKGVQRRGARLRGRGGIWCCGCSPLGKV